MLISTLLIFVPISLGMIAHLYVQIQFRRLKNVYLTSGVKGQSVALQILQSVGIFDVVIDEIEDELGDYYDPTKKNLILSTHSFHGTSISSVALAAHEAGHALQDKIGYRWIVLRMKLIPTTLILSQLLPILFFIGFFMQAVFVVKMTAFIYSILFILQWMTLGVEIDASKRASQLLLKLGIVNKDELTHVQPMLKAAVFIYFASFVSSFSDLFHLLLSSKQK